ncbi:DUF58 domain-containing protein [Pseudomonas abieticivorans]|uniref:DUF58 domain-containing protein n=1 Tax=Pseudomonas abieticivorans TaxID=2931382 RepID=UPI0020BFD2D6|nr:DUF58 domain-containing protein [Pseudomonas sp. PIA16]
MAAQRGAGAVIAGLRLGWRRWQERRVPPASQVVLGRRQIFIWPSRAGMGFCLVLLLILLAAINYQNSMAYALVFLLGSVFVLAILHTYRNLSGLRVKGAGAAPVFVGEQARFVLRLESTGREHQAIAVGWSAADLQGVDLAAEHVLDLELALPSPQRGWMPAPRIRLETSFPLGVLRAWSWVDAGQAVLVYPRPLQGELPIAARDLTDIEDQGQRVQGQGVDDFQGLKVYHPGDSWRRLHWKAWSRGGPLLLKEFADLRGRDLCLDFEALGGDLEQRLSRLCYWVLELTRQQRPFALRLPGSHRPAECSEAHRDACLRALAVYGQGA